MLDGAALAAFLDERIRDGAPSVVVFAVDRVPPEVGGDPVGETLLTRYLESGGKVVWSGLSPFSLSFDPETGNPNGRTPERAEAFLGVDPAGGGFGEPLGTWSTATAGSGA